MKKQQMIAVYGTNLVMTTIVKCLEEKTQLQVHQSEQSFSDISELPDAERPDVIIFDLATAQSDLVISSLRNHPMLMMIGVDIENSRMLVLSGEQFRLMTTDDLMQVIEVGGFNLGK